MNCTGRSSYRVVAIADRDWIDQIPVLLPRFPAQWTNLTWDDLSLDTIHKTAADLILAVAVPFSETAGRLFERLRNHPLHRPVLAVLPPDKGEVAAPALEVVDDFLHWPIHGEEMRRRMMRLLGKLPSESSDEGLEALREQLSLLKLIGEDASFLAAVRLVPRMARAGLPVLITGETGTGKEMFARALHHLGPRHDCTFIPVDCGVLPEQLFENEMFGHVRGAYTDARSEQQGLAALAEGGTIFLDEVDALSLSAQAKLLRYLQDRTYRPLGSDRTIHSDVNVIAASNRDLETAVREKRFRQDLFFRLNVLRLQLPSLRERKGDVPLLARYFLGSFHYRKVLSPAAVCKLKNYDWPGNVRELHNVIQRAAIATDDVHILPSHIEVPGVLDPEVPPPLPPFRAARAETLSAFERTYVGELLRKYDGNVTRAAREAGKERRAFGKLAKKYGLSYRSST